MMKVGGQIDVVYSPNDKLSFNLNGSIASRHYQYEDTDTSSALSYKRIDRNNSFIPSLDDPFSPFWEIFTEGEYYASEKVYVKVAFARQSSLVYNQLNPFSSERISTTTIPVEVKYSLSDLNTLTFIGEQQWADNSIRIGEKTYMNHYLSLTFSRSPNINLTLNTEFTDDDEEPTGKNSGGLLKDLIKLMNQILFSFPTDRKEAVSDVRTVYADL